MAKEQLPEQDILEGAPEEYRIVLRRNAMTEEVEDIEEFLARPPDDNPDPNDIMWEGRVPDLKQANLWELAGLVPTLESDVYELQFKVGDNEYRFVATFSSQDDYDDAVAKVTDPSSLLIDEELGV